MVTRVSLFENGSLARGRSKLRHYKGMAPQGRSKYDTTMERTCVRE